LASLSGGARPGSLSLTLKPVSLTIKRSSLVAEVANSVRGEIFRGAWTEWIPSTRELSQSINVSRNTCRAALQILYREKLLEPVRGRGTRIKRTVQLERHSAGRNDRSVGVILPEGLGRLPPRVAHLIEELQADLYHLQARLELHASPAFFQADPRRALEKLVEKNQHDCWILVLSHRALQEWFMQRGLPCMVSGSIYSDILLPSVDLDFRAICRHAAGVLIAKGHQRIALLNRRRLGAGDMESEAGFNEGAMNSSREAVDARVVYHDDSVESVSDLIRKLFVDRDRPTGLIVANPFCYLSVMTTLLRSGFRVPEDVSLISREDDPFLAYVSPEPARYFYDVTRLARRHMMIIRPLLEGGGLKFDPVRIEPRFTAGGSIKNI